MLGDFIKNRKQMYMPGLLGLAAMSAAAFILEKEAAAGILSILGIFFFLLARKHAETENECIALTAVIWMGLSLRFSTELGTALQWRVIMAGCFAPAAVFLGMLMQAENFLKNKNIPGTEIWAFPVGYTLLALILSVIKVGNAPNLFTYCMCIPIFGNNLIWLGEYGMTAAVVLILVLIAAGMAADSKKKKYIYITAGIILTAGLFLSGAILQKRERKPDYTIKAALGVCEEMDFMGEEEKEYTLEERIEIFRKQVEDAAEEGADILVMCEEFTEVPREDEESVLKTYSDIIKKNGIPVLATFDVSIPDEPGDNTAVLFDEKGNIVFSYKKSNLVPFIETSDYVEGSGIPGAGICSIGGHEINVACLICFDINDEFLTDRIPEDTELLILPCWEWDSANLEQTRVRFRSVEYDTTLLKHAYEGFSFASDPFGNVGNIIDNRNAYERISMLEVPVWEK